MALRFGWFIGSAHRGSGRLVRQERDVDAFHGVRLASFGTVLVEQGPSRVQVEADDDLVDRVTTSVVDGVLRVGWRGGGCVNATVRVHVRALELDLLRVSGAGSIETVAPLACRELTLRLGGSGRLSVSGSAEHSHVELSGAGEVRAFGLVARRCEVRLSGTGTCEVHAVDELRAKVSGVGTVTYRGEPRALERTVSGLGSIRQAR